MMCRLYNLMDLYIIPTRWEGAPRQVFDVLECNCKIISTPVGIVPEIIPSDCIFDCIPAGVDLILRDMETDFLEQFVEPSRQKIAEHHSIHSVAKQWEAVYKRVIEQESKKTKPVNATPKKLLCMGKQEQSIFLKPISVLLNKTRIGKFKKKYFPTELAIVVKEKKKKRIFYKISGLLLGMGIKLTDDVDAAKYVLVWMEPETKIDENLMRRGKKIILVIDENCCNRLLDEEQNHRQQLRLQLETADTTTGETARKPSSLLCLRE